MLPRAVRQSLRRPAVAATAIALLALAAARRIDASECVVESRMEPAIPADSVLSIAKVIAPPALRAINDEVNLARSHPETYARYLEAWLPRIAGDRLFRPGLRPLRLTEGRSAVEEAIRFLRAEAPCPPLVFSTGMSRGADDLAREQARTGAKGHVAADGSRVADRLRRHGTWRGKAAELVQYGGLDARETVALLIVDDGVSGRGHRAAIFDPDYRRLGAAVGPHARYRTMCVLTLASAYADEPALASGP